ncbi:MAG: phage portal protein [Treponema sp.]|nr:phage portal protein [Treponema sp.]
MNIFKRLLPGHRREPGTSRREDNKKLKSFSGNPSDFLIDDENYNILGIGQPTNQRFDSDSYLLNAWVNIAVNILIRNIARADFTIKRDGEDVTNGPLYDLFHKKKKKLSRYDLWKETAGWWFLEGEAFWWFGPDYSGGLPREIFILNPPPEDAV